MSIKRIATASALVVGGLLTAATMAMAHEPATPLVLKEGQGHSLTIGSKRTVVYFLTRDGDCRTSFVVGAQAGDAQAVDPTRFIVDIAPGKSFRMAGSKGYGLMFKCAGGAKDLLVRPITQVAYRGN